MSNRIEITDDLGFVFDGIQIINPTVDECGMEPVHPDHYGFFEAQTGGGCIAYVLDDIVPSDTRDPRDDQVIGQFVLTNEHLNPYADWDENETLIFARYNGEDGFYDGSEPEWQIRLENGLIEMDELGTIVYPYI
jgi:hypothetical protein